MPLCMRICFFSVWFHPLFLSLYQPHYSTSVFPCTSQAPKPQIVHMDEGVTQELRQGMQEYVRVWAGRENTVSLAQEVQEDLIQDQMEGTVTLEVLGAFDYSQLRNLSGKKKCKKTSILVL